jgi:hypothetical protein
MACYQVYLDDPSEIAADWLERTREKVLEKWTTTTRHRPESSHGTWACEIATGCRTCDEHLSLPCSLLSEANEIAAFLSTTCFTSDPAIFLRLYLIILSEFVGQLEKIANLMDLRLRTKPKRVCMWANRWAKHRLQILLQHHPRMAFADQYGERRVDAERRYRSQPLEDGCGRKIPTRIIDSGWLERNYDNRLSVSEANGPGQALILVPPMEIFLDEMMAYFREFVDKCLEDPGRVRRFESAHFVRGC